MKSPSILKNGTIFSISWLYLSTLWKKAMDIIKTHWNTIFPIFIACLTACLAAFFAWFNTSKQISALVKMQSEAEEKRQIAKTNRRNEKLRSRFNFLINCTTQHLLANDFHSELKLFRRFYLKNPKLWENPAITKFYYDWLLNIDDVKSQISVNSQIMVKIRDEAFKLIM